MAVTDSPLSKLVRLLCDLRLAALALAIVVEALTDRSPAVTLVLLAAVPLSYVPLRRWEAIGGHVGRMPVLMVLDVAYAAVLFTLTSSPELMLVYGLVTVGLAGLVFQAAGALVGGGLMSLVMSAAAVAGLIGGWAEPASSFTLIGYAILYAAAAVGSCTLRRILDDYVLTAEQAATESRRAAHAEERARLAREMHDRVSKTLHGIRLLAVSVNARADARDVESVDRLAEELVRATEMAADDARRLLRDLRADSVDGTVADAFAQVVREWAEGQGVPAHVEVPEQSPVVGVSTRYEALAIVGEALENVARHAEASQVWARARETAGWLELRIEDDGRGIDDLAPLRELRANGHYGVLGMTERAHRVGGSVDLSRRPAGGTRLVLRVPTANALDRSETSGAPEVAV